MNKNIKYIIEEIQKFNPIDYQEDEYNIINNDKIKLILDPIQQLLNFLETFKWEKKKQYSYIKNISYEDFVLIRNRIINTTKNQSEHLLDKNKALLYFNEDTQTVFIGLFGIEKIYKYKLAILYKEESLENLSNLNISEENNGIEFNFEIHKTINPDKSENNNSEYNNLFLRHCCLINPELFCYKFIGTVNKRIINKLIEKFINI